MAMDEYQVPPAEWDSDSQMRWIREHERLLWSAILSYTRQYERDDLWQMACESALQAFRQFEPARGTKLSTYVYRCVRNTMNMKIRGDHTRKRSAVVLSLTGAESGGGYENLDLRDRDTLRDPQPDIEESVTQADAAVCLRRIIRKTLTREERQVFERLMEGRTQARIARELGCSRTRVSGIIRRSRLKILCAARKAGVVED